MTVGDAQLPEGFAALEAFVPIWASERSSDRARRRLDSTEGERAAFHAAVQPLLGDALERLDRKPLGSLDAAETRLLNLLLAFAHVAMSIEVQGEDENRFAELSRHMRITRASADERYSSS